MVLNFDEEIARYKQELESKIKTLEAQRSAFNTHKKKLIQIATRIEKSMRDYQDAYDELIASGVSTMEAKANNIDSLYNLTQKIRTSMKDTTILQDEVETTPTTHERIDSQSSTMTISSVSPAKENPTQPETDFIPGYSN